MQAFHSADDEQILWHYLQRLKQVSIWRPFSGRGFDIDSDYRVELVPGGGFVRVEQVTRHELMFNCSIDDHVYGCIESDSPQYWHFRVRGNCSKRVDGTNYRLSSLETRGPNSIKVFGLHSNPFMYGGGGLKAVRSFFPGLRKNQVKYAKVEEAMIVCQTTGVQFEFAVLFAGLKALGLAGEGRGFAHKGVFRVSGLAKGIEKREKGFEKRERHCLKKCEENVIAALIKKFVKDRMRLFPSQVFGEITEIVQAQKPERNEKWNTLHSQIEDEVDMKSLCYLVYKLKQVADLSAMNKMDAHNLATCFAPEIVADPPEDISNPPEDISDPAKIRKDPVLEKMLKAKEINETKVTFFQFFLDGFLDFPDLTNDKMMELDEVLKNCMGYFFN